MDTKNNIYTQIFSAFWSESNKVRSLSSRLFAKWTTFANWRSNGTRSRIRLAHKKVTLWNERVGKCSRCAVRNHPKFIRLTRWFVFFQQMASHWDNVCGCAKTLDLHLRQYGRRVTLSQEFIQHSSTRIFTISFSACRWCTNILSAMGWRVDWQTCSIVSDKVWCNWCDDKECTQCDYTLRTFEWFVGFLVNILNDILGTVSLWSPNVKEPLVKMLAHPCAVRGISIDESGTYMATSGLDRTLR